MLRLAHFPVALCLCYPLTNALADTYKCTDGRQITYANVPCEEMNLKSAGSIKSLVTVVPTAPTSVKLNKEDKPVESSASKVEETVTQSDPVKQAPSREK